MSALKSILIPLAILSGFACGNGNELPNQNSGQTVSQSIEKRSDIWVEDGNMQSDTILIFSEGGPKWGLDIKEKGKTNYRYLPNYKNYGIAFVHQSQTLDDRIHNLDRVLTLKEAKEEVAKNTKMLHTAISHFKNKNKVVIVIGKSFGAYAVQDYLASKQARADRYFILAGRLSVNEAMTQQQLRGFNGGFAADGITYIPEDENADLSDYSKEELLRYQNKQMLKAGYGTNNYIERLKEVDLSKVCYIYGTADQNIGSLTPKEIAFLKQKKVELIKTDKDHSGVTYAFIDRLLDGRIQL